MSVLAALLGEQRSNIETIMRNALTFYDGTDSGVVVTPGSSLKNAAVYACVRILAETVASLPLIVYERRGRRKERAQNHYLYEVLHDRPNEAMTSFEFRETLQGHLALWGNAYAQIDYDSRGRVEALWPLRPDRVLRIVTEGGRRRYWYQLPTNEMVWLGDDRIWHLRGLGSDGLSGYSPISLMRQAVGLGMAAEEYGARFFGNGARPSGVLEHPGKITPDAHNRMKDSWNEAHMGLSQSHKVAILEEGVKYQQIGIPPEDAQFLETRKFQVQEIARAFRVPPHMLADLERATFSNIEHQSIEFVVHTIRPWLVRWEQSINQFLLLPSERERYYGEFLVDGLLRGDTLSRYEAYSVGRQNGFLSANDIRELENMNPIDGGDVYLIPLNMVPSGTSVPAGTGESRAITDVPDEELRLWENREERSLVSRRRIMYSQKPVLEELFARIYRREINDVGAALKKMARQRASSPEFEAWLRDFYQEHEEWTIEQVRSVFLAYAKMIAGEAAEEVEAEIEMNAVANFVDKYAASFAERQSAYSEERILGILQDGGTLEDVLTALEDEFEVWRTDRPDWMAHSEMVQQANASSKFAYSLAGVLAVRWKTYNKSCPYCTRLDGKVVGIKQHYIASGEDFEPEDGGAPLRPSVNVGHPPAHKGCDCMITAAVI